MASSSVGEQIYIVGLEDAEVEVGVLLAQGFDDELDGVDAGAGGVVVEFFVGAVGGFCEGTEGEVAGSGVHFGRG